jgi:DNA-directed RNA polymerase beta' subunit
VLARSAFDETKKHLKNSAVRGERDPLNSVVENIILGQLIPIGTGNLELAPKAAKAPDSILENIEQKRQEIREEKERKMEQRRQEAEEEAADQAVGTDETADERDYTELANKNIAEIKNIVAEADSIDLERLLEVEKDNKNRKTMKAWLQDQIDDTEA